MSKSFHELLASDASLSPAFRAAFADDGPVECDWCGCTTHEPVSLNGLQFAPSCVPAYEADQAEQGAIDLEDIERRLSRAFDLINSELPGSHFRNLHIARMKRKQAARETGADYGRSTTGDLIGDKADQYGDVDRQGIEDVA
jgi:hypothetical protein